MLDKGNTHKKKDKKELVSGRMSMLDADDWQNYHVT